MYSGSIWPYAALEMLAKLDFRFAKMWFPVFFFVVVFFCVFFSEVLTVSFDIQGRVLVALG